MAEDLTDPSELEDPISTLSAESGPRRGLTVQAVMAILAVVVIVAGALFWTLSHVEVSRDIGKERQALAENWTQAQLDEAQGVNFSIVISNDEVSGSPSLSFEHNGVVTVRDSCFEAKSEYLVKEDGSLAIEDLTNHSIVGTGVTCEAGKLTPIFWTSTMIFDSTAHEGSWVAYDAEGKVLVTGFKAALARAIL